MILSHMPRRRKPPSKPLVFNGFWASKPIQNQWNFNGFANVAKVPEKFKPKHCFFDGCLMAEAFAKPCKSQGVRHSCTRPPLDREGHTRGRGSFMESALMLPCLTFTFNNEVHSCLRNPAKGLNRIHKVF